MGVQKAQYCTRVEHYCTLVEHVLSTAHVSSMVHKLAGLQEYAQAPAEAQLGEFNFALISLVVITIALKPRVILEVLCAR